MNLKFSDKIYKKVNFLKITESFKFPAIICPKKQIPSSGNTAMTSE